MLSVLTGCVSINDHRTPQQKSLNDKVFDTISAPVDDFLLDKEEDSLPDEETEKEPPIGENFRKPISLSVSEGMRVREILMQMAQLAEVNLFMAKDVEESMSFSAKNRPFLDVLDDVCGGAGLRYSINENSVKIEIDTPMLRIYNVQFLNLQRNTKSNVSVSTDIFMNHSIGNKDGSSSIKNDIASANNGSSSFVSGEVKSDFWAELEAALKSIVGAEGGAYVSIHRQGGLVTVFAPQNKQKNVKKYLRLLKDTTESQVLIEAKILEVNLRDEYRNGINWNIVRHGGATLKKSYSTVDGLLSFGIARENLNIVTGLIEKFGAVKTLSNPRVTVLNNQLAVLKVAQNDVVYLPELQRQYATVADNRSTDFLSTSITSIPIGLIMSVIPAIDRKNKTILLNLRPTISRIVNYKEVPFFYHTSSAANNGGAANNASDIQYHKIPIVDVRELDSVLKLNSGQIVVMGGFMQESSANNRDGLPRFKQMNMVAGSNEKNTSVTELVIFLKATILRKKGRAHHEADSKMYKVFANDPRPLEFTK
ncbi:MAG: secretin N-terminal domain-containing protein [Holosporaceae bacterium]|nr:secretin N-terminal domain-containing protein [Holosporaceae bacterium]